MSASRALSCLFADYSQSDANEQGVRIDTVARWVWSGSQARPGRNCLRERPSFQGLSARGQVRTTSQWTVAHCTVWVFRVPCNCRPCMRPAGSQHTSELSTRQGSPIRVVRRLVETRQEDDDVRMLLFLGLLGTPCSNGWPRSIGRAVLSRCTDAGRGGRVSRSRHHARHNIEAARKPAGCHRDQESCERCALPACDPSQLSAVIMPAEKLHLRGRADHC